MSDATNSSEASRVPGLYLARKQQIRFNMFGSPGSGSWEWTTEFYLLSREGRVYRGRDLPSVPGGDIHTFDYDAAQREDLGNSGTYVVQGNVVVLRIGDNEPIEARRLEGNVLQIQNTNFTRSTTGD